MADAGRAVELATLQGVRFLGFVFYEPSPRNAFALTSDDFAKMPSSVMKVGVFVDTPVDEIVNILSSRDIKWVQLHGKESPEFCGILKKRGFNVIKAFAIGEMNSQGLNEMVRGYEGVADFFLFDTAGHSVGGNGKKFDWNILSGYSPSVPFILSGGIAPDDFSLLIKLRNTLGHRFAGIDINSRFEESPGKKNVELVKDFTRKLYAG